MAEPRPSGAFRLVLWVTTVAIVAGVGFVAWLPGPELPGVYAGLAALHDSLVRGAVASPQGDGLLIRVESRFDDAPSTTWLHRFEGAMVTVHETDAALPRPRGATNVPGVDGYAFEREDLLFMVRPGKPSWVLSGYVELGRLAQLSNRLDESGPRGFPSITRPVPPLAPRSPALPDEPSTR